MKKYISVIIAFIVMGCSSTKQYDSSTLPVADTFNFPAYNIGSEITEGIKWKFADGSMKMRMEMEKWKRQPNSSDYIFIDNKVEVLSWDQEIDDNMYHVEVFLDNDMKFGFTSNLKGENIEIDLFYKGKKIDLRKLSNIDQEQAFEFEQFIISMSAQLGDYAKHYLSNFGKTFKSDDEIPLGMYYKSIMTDINQRKNIPDFFDVKYNGPRSVIKGYGIFNDKCGEFMGYYA